MILLRVQETATEQVLVVKMPPGCVRHEGNYEEFLYRVPSAESSLAADRGTQKVRSTRKLENMPPEN